MSNPNMREDESSADYCRRMGWTPGARLIGTEGDVDGPGWSNTTTITITAIGRTRILAVADGRNGRENIWTLKHRDWKPATQPEGADQ